jgi:hypothetical protein
MSLGILFLIFAVENLIAIKPFMALFYLVYSVMSIITSYAISERSKAIYNTMVWSREVLYGIVLEFFKSVNSRIQSKLSLWYMEKETSEHIHSLSVVSCVVLPASLLYVFVDFYFFRENALDSMIWGLLIFFYSNFLPDLPSIYRMKKENRRTKDLPWYEKYALLLLAPLLIWALFSGMRLKWRTTETFHNFKSLTIYGTFLFLLSLFTFGAFPLSIGDVMEIVFLPLCGVIGYLTHLKVDRIW